MDNIFTLPLTYNKEMENKRFIPSHLNATSDDLAGNNGVGRYILLPGSEGRAKEISTHFVNASVKSHSREHHLYLGELKQQEGTIDVATISTGMGCPSMEIILHELFHLGGKRFLRVGTAGSLQPGLVLPGNFINAIAAVRDEQTTQDYAPITLPAIASYDMMAAIVMAATRLKVQHKLLTGTVHCKSSLYAREFGEGPKAEINKAYLHLLSQCGVLASEMETAALFIQSQLYDHQLMQLGRGPGFRVLAGAILGVVALPSEAAYSLPQEQNTQQQLIELSLETVKVLAQSEIMS